MPGYKEAFPFDCLSCGDPLDREVHAASPMDHASTDTVEYADQDGYFVRPDGDYRQALHAVPDGEELKTFLTYADGHRVGREGERQPPCAVHAACTDALDDAAELVAVDDDGEEPALTYELPVGAVHAAFPATARGADAPLVQIPDHDGSLAVELTHIGAYRDARSLDGLF